MREVKRNVLWALRGKGYLLSLEDQKNLYAEGSIELFLEKMDKISVSEMGEETEVLGSW